MIKLVVCTVALCCAVILFLGCGDEQGKSTQVVPSKPALLEQGTAKRPDTVVSASEFLTTPLQHEGREVGIEGRISTVVASVGQFILTPLSGGG